MNTACRIMFSSLLWKISMHIFWNTVDNENQARKITNRYYARNPITFQLHLFNPYQMCQRGFLQRFLWASGAVYNPIPFLRLPTYTTKFISHFLSMAHGHALLFQHQTYHLTPEHGTIQNSKWQAAHILDATESQTGHTPPRFCFARPPSS